MEQSTQEKTVSFHVLDTQLNYLLEFDFTSLGPKQDAICSHREKSLISTTKWENNPENSAEVKALPLLLLLPNGWG